MKGFPRIGMMAVCLMFSLAIMVSGCKSSSSSTSSTSAANPASDATDANDPANANVVPISNDTSGTTASDTTSSAPASGQPDQYSTAQYNQDNGYGQEPESYAPQPPPPLPQYDQPPCPQDGDIWTPGYWAYAQPSGYYWVPGAWVQAPYVGALWTPGYWGWRDGRYAFYRGYWGRHIGYYGGINYGFGYTGVGYQGGYWRGNQFAYNSAVNRVNTMEVHNVYDYRIRDVSTARISYNGGTGGLQYRPRASEILAIREEHTPPMTAQVEIRKTAMSNRGNFYDSNHGRPAAAVETHAVMADRNVRPPAVVNYSHGERPQEPARATPEQQRPENRTPSEMQRPENRQAPEQNRPQAHGNPVERRPETRPAPQQTRPEAHGGPVERRPETRPAPQQHKPEARPEKKPEEKRPNERK